MQDGSGRAPLSGGRLTAVVLLAVVALLAFLLLADVRLSEGDPLFGPVTEATSRPNWTVLLVATEALCLVAALLLVAFRPREQAWPGEDWTPTSQTTGGRAIQIGCPGCGTVFEKPEQDVDEPHEQTFRCPNCGRAGRLRMGVHHSVELKDLVCKACGTSFRGYREGAECPRCHAPAT